MSRNIGASNITETAATHVRPVWLFKLEFDTPVYVHSGIGNLIDTFVSPNITYVGAGAAGSIGSIQESDEFAPQPITLSLSGVSDAYLTEAIDAGNYGDRVTVYKGYKDASGALVAAPWIVGAGIYEKADITQGNANTITIIVQHFLMILNDKDGRRFSDESQTSEYPGDTGCAFLADMVNKKLVFGDAKDAVAGILANFIKNRK